jgi:glycosyltransferase involved in cell wall biosynthesis
MGKRSADAKTQMKVAFIEQEAQLGGVEYTTLRVAQAFDKSRFELVIVCPEDGDLPRLARQTGLNVHVVPRPSFSSVSFFWKNQYRANPLGFVITAINVFRSADTLYRYLTANPADIILTKGLLAHFYGGLVAHRLNIPCIWYVQEEVDAKRAGGLFRLILEQGAKRLADRVVVDAIALLEQFRTPTKIGNTLQVIYNGIDTDQFAPFSDQERQDARAKFGIPENTVVIGQAGRLIPLKGQAVLLQAFIALVKEFPDLHLVFVGAPLFGNRDYEQALHKQAAQSSLAERVHFTGFLPDVRQGMAAMDIFINASVETDSPVSVMEAMSCGLPVVVSGVRGTLEMVTPGCDAFVFPPGDSKALVLILAKLLRDRKLRAEIGVRARASIKQKFSLYASVAKLEALLEEVYAA